MWFEIAPDLAALLILAAFVAGFVDSIAGGGGLITVPALLLAGASPIETLATNKLQGSFGSGTAMITYARAGHINLRDQAVMAGVSALSAAAGAMVAHLLPAEALRLIMPAVLIAVAIYFAIKPGLTDADKVHRITPALFTFTFVPLIAAYDGFFGPGTGSFFMLGFVLLAGFGLLRATAHTKTLNFASNIGSLAVFAFSGATWWAVGLCMGLAQMVGAMLGARLAMRIGAGLIKPLLVVTSTAMAARLLWQIWV
jgi:uncharacterized membrane protein YfcA